MRYSTWLRLNVAAAVVLFVIFSALFLVLLGGPGIALSLVLGLLLVLTLAVGVARMQRAMDQYGGSPMAGFWGAVGFDIVPDDYDDGGLDDGSASNDVPRPTNSGAPALSEDAGPSPVVAEAPRRVCRACGAFTDGIGSAFCRVCGAPL